jgi:beta-glucosidase
MIKQIVVYLICMSVLCVHAIAQQKPWIDFNSNGRMDVYEDPDASTDNRVNDLLLQMTVYEKIQILYAEAPAIPRLGIKKYDHGNEALHGVVRPGNFTVFPQAIGLAATWNPDLIYEVSTAISDEARGRWNELGEGKLQLAKFSDLLAFWSPTVNMARDPRWGRTPETYGEDPYLTSRIGVSFVKGLQGNNPRYLKVVSTPKHFAGNNEEHNRFSCNAKMSERALRSYYLPAFKALITEGRAQSIMSAYNAINGAPCTANKWLLTTILRNEWGFNGYIVSDCGAPGFLYSDHKYATTLEDAAAIAVKSGLDLECGGYCKECSVFRDYLSRAYEMGKVTESEINNAAFRVLRARFKLGIFDDSGLNPYAKISPSVVGCMQHQQLALETAKQSVVLLKNEGNILPLDVKKIKKLAVLGINANSCEFGDYSGTPVNNPVSPYQGIVNRAGNRIQVKTLTWMGKLSEFEAISSEYLSCEFNGQAQKGLKAEYFSNASLQGTPKQRVDRQILFDPANQPPDPVIPNTPLSIRWTGNLTPKVSGKYVLALRNDDGMCLLIDKKLVVDRWNNNDKTDSVTLELVAGKKYPIEINYCNREGSAYASFLWKTPAMKRTELYSREKNLAKNSDAVIIVAGINKMIEREGLDRETLDLPADQMDFIREISKTNSKTIVVLIAGSSMTINWLQDHIPAIVNAWYPGEQGGNAIAAVLFGDYNPAGRLPLTYYKSMEDLPPFDDYEVFNERTYMYSKKEPLYPFGYGLSYTTFKYNSIQADHSEIYMGDTINVLVEVQNTGKYDGEEVVQLYLKYPDTTEIMPIKQLKAFKRIALKKGEKKNISFLLSREDMSFWNSRNEFVPEAGEYNILVGASSEDIRQKISFIVMKRTSHGNNF